MMMTNGQFRSVVHRKVIAEHRGWVGGRGWLSPEVRRWRTSEMAFTATSLLQKFRLPWSAFVLYGYKGDQVQMAVVRIDPFSLR